MPAPPKPPTRSPRWSGSIPRRSRRSPRASNAQLRTFPADLVNAARGQASGVLDELAGKSANARKVRDAYVAFRDKIADGRAFQAVLEARQGNLSLYVCEEDLKSTAVRSESDRATPPRFGFVLTCECPPPGLGRVLINSAAMSASAE